MKHDNNWMPEYTGPFKDLIPDYVRYKRALNYTMGEPILYRLKEMDLYFKSLGIVEIKITREMYDSYTSVKDGEKPTNAEKRIAAIRGFAKYLRSIGTEDVYTGEDDTRVFKRDFIPYIFSGDEILSIFSVMKKNCGTTPGRRPETFLMMMTLYYCCGMRKSEVQKLNIRDINFETGTLTILHGKNDVSRLIPVSESVRIQLCAYRDKYILHESADSPLFCYERGKRVNDGMLYYDFRKLLTDACIHPRADGSRQRLHDLRHTFCVRTLEMMEKKGFDLYTSLPLLSTYLGHKHITETEYYLRMMEDHFGTILEKTRNYTEGLFPETPNDPPATGSDNKDRKGAAGYEK